LQTSSNTSSASWTNAGISFDSSAATFTNTTTAAAGTVANQVANSFNRPTFASTNAITVTNASNVYISNNVIAGTNTTITNSHSLHIGGGRTFMGGAGSPTVPTLAIRNVDTGLYSSAVNTLNVSTGGTLAATFNSTGNFTAVGTVTANSDIRLKDNIEIIPNALEKVSQIRGVTFTRNDQEDKEKRHAGVIAQEIEKVLPEVVMEDSEGIKSVAYGNLVGLLIEAIKEQQEQINNLKKEIEGVKK
jgi:hypothetical protein